MKFSEISSLYSNKKYTEIVDIVENNQEIKNNEYCKMILGFSYLQLQQPQKAINCLRNIKTSEQRKFFGEIYRCLGLCEYILGSYEQSANDFNKSALFGDEESVLWKKLLFPESCVIHQTENVIFRFIGEVDKFEKKLFIMRGLKAYSQIVNFINKDFTRKKIDVYVYKERIDSIGNPLSYTDNGTKSIHIHYKDFIGHEIAHALFNSIYPIMQRNVMIDEGIATFFDQPFTLQEYIEKNQKNIKLFDVFEYWENSNARTSMHGDYYWLAGAFVGYLIEKFGKESFLRFIEIQTPSNAEKIFKQPPKKLVSDFYEILSRYNDNAGT